MKPRKDYHRNHSKADELEDVCKPCKAQRDAARRRNRATVSTLASWLHFSAFIMGAFIWLAQMAAVILTSASLNGSIHLISMTGLLCSKLVHGTEQPSLYMS